MDEDLARFMSITDASRDEAQMFLEVRVRGGKDAFHRLTPRRADVEW